jgi:glutathione S-transferase
MRLLLSPTSPYARKVHVALLEKGLAVELVYVATVDPAVSAANPLGKIPALVREDGSTLYDSAVILQYLEVIAPTPPFYPADPLARVEALRWEALCDGICDAAVAQMIERRRAPERQEPKATAHQEAKIARGLATLEADLTGR